MPQGLLGLSHLPQLCMFNPIPHILFPPILFTFLTAPHINPLEIPAHRSPSEVPVLPLPLLSSNSKHHPLLLFKSSPLSLSPCPLGEVEELSRCSEWRPLLYRIRLPVSGGATSQQPGGLFREVGIFRGRGGAGILSWGKNHSHNFICFCGQCTICFCSCRWI